MKSFYGSIGGRWIASQRGAFLREEPDSVESQMKATLAAKKADKQNVSKPKVSLSSDSIRD
jgi:hypothetical protein